MSPLGGCFMPDAGLALWRNFHLAMVTGASDITCYAKLIFTPTSKPIFSAK
ncbi:MAG: hypothetical protein ACJAUW_001164, partial [Yoonia sp.]